MIMPKVKFGEAITILLWVAALGILVENVALFRQNRRLRLQIQPLSTP